MKVWRTPAAVLEWRAEMMREQGVAGALSVLWQHGASGHVIRVTLDAAGQTSWSRQVPKEEKAA